MKKIIFIVLFVLIALSPMLVKTLVDKEIDKIVVQMHKENGLKLNILNSKGYFISTRNYSLVIEDTKKFRKFISDRFSTYYEDLFNIDENDEDFNTFLKAMIFKGYIQNSNLNYFDDVSVNMYLDKVLSENKNKIFQKLVEKKLLNINMLFDNQANFKYAKLKDIDESIKLKKGEDLKLLVLGQEIKDSSKKERLIYKILTKKFIFDYKNIDKKITINFEDLKYDVSMKNSLENKSDIKVKNIFIYTDEFEFKSKNIDLKNDYDLEKNLYSSYFKIKTEDFSLKDEKSDIFANEINLKVDTFHLDYKTLQRLEKLYLKMENTDLSTKTFVEDNKAFLDEINKLINKTFRVKLKLALDDFTDKDNISLKNIKINLDEKVLKNNIDLRQVQSIAEFLPIIDSDIYISMFKEDLGRIVRLNAPLGMMLFSVAKEEKDKFSFNIQTKKGKIFINGKSL